MRYFDSLFSIKIFSELRLPYELQRQKNRQQKQVLWNHQDHKIYYKSETYSVPQYSYPLLYTSYPIIIPFGFKGGFHETWIVLADKANKVGADKFAGAETEKINKSH